MTAARKVKRRPLPKAKPYVGVLPPAGFYRLGRKTTKGERIDAWLVGQYEAATGVSAEISNQRCRRADRANEAVTASLAVAA